MVLPHRGQMLPPEAQVVPQLEQVLTRQPQPRLLPAVVFWQPQPVVVPAVEAVVSAVTAEASLKAQEDWGNSGSEKNTSHTDSANSSQGGISQKP